MFRRGFLKGLFGGIAAVPMLSKDEFPCIGSLADGTGCGTCYRCDKEIEELSRARLIRKGLEPFQLSTHNLDGTAILYKREKGTT